MSMWSHVAYWILNHRSPILLVVAVLTVFLGYWTTQITTDHTTGHFLSKESRTIQDFQRASEVFGESQTILYLVFEDLAGHDTRQGSDRNESLARCSDVKCETVM